MSSGKEQHRAVSASPPSRMGNGAAAKGPRAEPLQREGGGVRSWAGPTRLARATGTSTPPNSRAPEKPKSSCLSRSLGQKA